MTSKETYTPGYDAAALSFMTRRTAQSHAAFLLPKLKAGMRLLDCGCGPGSISAGLAHLIAPGELTGIDRESSQLKIAAENLSCAGLKNATFQEAVIYQLPFGAETFDVVFAHAVFEHLSAPQDALKEIMRVLKPGGLVALRSPDWGGFIVAPLNPGVEEGIEHFKRLQTSNGGDVYVGRKLKGLLLSAGFHDVLPSATYEVYEPLGPLLEFLAARVEGSEGAGIAPGRALSQWASALRQLSADPAGLFLIAWCEVLGSKPLAQ